MTLNEEEEKKTNTNKTKFQDYKRFHSSKKGTFITFSNLDLVPEMLTDVFNEKPDLPNNVSPRVYLLYIYIYLFTIILQCDN